MENIKKNKKLNIECKTAQCDPKVLHYITNVRNRILIDIAFKILMDKTNNEKAG